MSRTLLLDSDIIAYKFASACETVVYFDGRDSPPCVDSDFESAAKQAEDYIADLVGHLGADRAIVCLSDPQANFRKDVWAGYKAKRVGVRKPEDLMRLKSWMAERYQTFQRPALEADDCMGILSTHPKLIPGEKIVVSEDKDMQTIPGLLFNPRQDSKPRRITQLEADRYFLYQTIVGDSTDGYPGAPGVGPKSPEAQAVLVSKSAEEAWGFVLQAFERSYLKQANVLPDPDINAVNATCQARLARILRWTDFDFKARRPVLWQPPVSA